MSKFVGKCTAPSIDNEKLQNWKNTIVSLDNDFIEPATMLIGIIEEAKSLKQIPDITESYKLDEWQNLFDKSVEPVRGMLFHALWYVRELKLGRHPDL